MLCSSSLVAVAAVCSGIVIGTWANGDILFLRAGVSSSAYPAADRVQ